MILDGDRLEHGGIEVEDRRGVYSQRRIDVAECESRSRGECGRVKPAIYPLIDGSDRLRRDAGCRRILAATVATAVGIGFRNAHRIARFDHRLRIDLPSDKHKLHKTLCCSSS